MKRALVIEDHPDNLRLMEYALRHAGYEVVAAMSGEDGVRMALESSFAFIVTDINLPGLDGYEVVRRIRRSPAHGAVPIIAITSHAMAGDRERILGCGCNGYFEKPIDPLTIVARIHQLLATADQAGPEEQPT